MKRTSYVDPIIGTVGDEQKESMHGGGKTHPCATYPYGMVQLGPDTTTSGDNGTGYNYCQSTIEGFSFNHMSGIGWYGDLGNIQIMPIVGKTDLRSGSNDEVPFVKGKDGWKSSFSHENEVALAGYYSVLLDRYNVKAEATVSEHTGMLRFTYPKSSESGIIFNFSRRIAGGADVEGVTISGNRIFGSITCTPKGGGFGRGNGNISYKLHFCLELSKEPKYTCFFENENLLNPSVKCATGSDLHLIACFDTEENEEILVKGGISYVDIIGAINNLNTECSHFDFDKLKGEADLAWENALSCASVQGGEETDLTLFYTCLYHTMLDPRTMTDCDGRFSCVLEGGMKSNYNHRTMFSGWDVYRSQFPWLTLIDPECVNDTIKSLLNIATFRNSSLPRWELMGNDSKCMVGDPGLIVLADAYVKGIDRFNYDFAYDLCKKSVFGIKESYGQEFNSLYPKDLTERTYVKNSLSETLEFLMANYALASFAYDLGEKEDYEYLLQRVSTYKDNYNKDLGFMCPRDENGKFIEVDSEYSSIGCVESNIFQQGWFAPYDIKGLCELFGKERAIALLERLFEEADFSKLWNEAYNHSNEPCHNITHYFNDLGLPRRTQYWTRRVQKEAYRLGAYGFCGNEDVGQLSAWYVLSALGFAQPCMGKPLYYINTPLFKRGEIKLNEKYHSCSLGTTFAVECDKDPNEYPYIEKIKLNGKEINEYYISYDQITNGGKLELILTK
ncbi:MAG: GH92 family glycosyl hydrolase [Clostridia bacterium]|nr:GH92 family glycosyl hydrolase [Clostridia bacterium]